MSIKKFESFVKNNEGLTKGIGYSDMDESDREYIIQKQKKKLSEDRRLIKYFKLVKFLSRNPDDIPRKQQLEILNIIERNIENMPLGLQEILLSDKN